MCIRDSQKSTYYSEATKIYEQVKKDAQNTKTEFEEAVENLNKTLENASGMYATEVTQPDGSTITYIHDKPTVEESKNVIKITSEAIGISNDAVSYTHLPAVNKVNNADVRATDYMHWWTFFGLYMEIGESTFSTVVSIRDKKRKGKKLEKWEQEYYKNNKSIVDLHQKSTERSDEEKAELRELFGLNK